MVLGSYNEHYSEYGGENKSGWPLINEEDTYSYDGEGHSIEIFTINAIVRPTAASQNCCSQNFQKAIRKSCHKEICTRNVSSFFQLLFLNGINLSSAANIIKSFYTFKELK